MGLENVLIIFLLAISTSTAICNICCCCSICCCNSLNSSRTIQILITTKSSVNTNNVTVNESYNIDQNSIVNSSTSYDENISTTPIIRISTTSVETNSTKYDFKIATSGNQSVKNISSVLTEIETKKLDNIFIYTCIVLGCALIISRICFPFIKKRRNRVKKLQRISIRTHESPVLFDRTMPKYIQSIASRISINKENEHIGLELYAYATDEKKAKREIDAIEALDNIHNQPKILFTKHVCESYGCVICPYNDPLITITTPKKQNFPNRKIKCYDYNIVYCIKCQKCKKEYFGETESNARVCLNQHINGIQNKNCNVISLHFNQLDHNYKIDFKYNILVTSKDLDKNKRQSIISYFIKIKNTEEPERIMSI